MTRTLRTVSVLFSLLALLGAPGALAAPDPVTGLASWYSRPDRGVRRLTASGEVFDERRYACASWRHPLGARLRITNPKNGKSVVCRVNDRGPARRLKKRAVDLTKASFAKIADTDLGLVRVVITSA